MTSCIPTELTNKDGWAFSLSKYQPDDETRREAIFALGNGRVMSRAASLESVVSEHHYPGTYCTACYEQLVSRVAGHWDETESLANLPNWLSLRFRIADGEWFCLDQAEFLEYRHGLDIKRGLVWREWTVRDAADRLTRGYEARLISMAEPNLAAIELQLTPLNWSAQVEVCSAIDGAVVNANVRRYDDYEKRHIEIVSAKPLHHSDMHLRARTRNSQVIVDQAVRTLIRGATVDRRHTLQTPAKVTQVFAIAAAKSVPVVIEKLAVISTSLEPGGHIDTANAVVALDQASGFSHVKAGHEAAWQQLWRQVGINSSQEDIALALRFYAFHLLQTISPHSTSVDTGVPARGWHGEVYRGQVFWDELFVLPFYNFRFPSIARSMLLYRYRRLDAARSAARGAGYSGAMFPWRSALTGKEVTPKHQKNLLTGSWTEDPTHLQHHVGSAIVFNVWRYYLTSDDYDFLSCYGAEIIFEVARFWASFARFNNNSGRFDINGVIGPDEYHNGYPDANNPGLKNNAYTNIMATWTLCRALELRQLLKPTDFQRLQQQLNLQEQEFERWDWVSRKLQVHFHDDGVISQFAGFDQLKPFELEQLPESLRSARTDWALEAEGEHADAYQVTKQADTLTLFYLFSEQEIEQLFDRLGYSYSRTQLQRTAAYYLQRSSHRSSLSQVVYAGALAYVDPANSWDLFNKSLATDLRGLDGESTAEGIHLGAMGGTLDILQRCYTGILPDIRGLRVFPAVPEQLRDLQLVVYFRGSKLDISASASGVEVTSACDNSRTLTLITPAGCIQLAPGSSHFVENTLAVEA